jgi:ubiquinone/menaquinone biosynthesis C-methylase UbiE
MARSKLHPIMSRAARLIADVGRHIDGKVRATSSALRPRPLDELREWGGVRLVRGKRVLDLGCGDGRFALGVASYALSVEGLDPDADGIATARKLARESGVGNVHFAVGAAQELPYRDASFDVAVLSWTL